VRYRTAAILSIVLVGGMFCLPIAIISAFRPSLPPPILLEVAHFCTVFKWVSALPIVVVLFTVAAFTNSAK